MTRSNRSRTTLLSEGLYNNRKLIKGRTKAKKETKKEEDGLKDTKDLFKKLLEMFGCT